MTGVNNKNGGINNLENYDFHVVRKNKSLANVLDIGMDEMEDFKVFKDKFNILEFGHIYTILGRVWYIDRSVGNVSE
jgi:hypothetical protein